MNTQNRILLSLTLSNLVLIGCIALVNSVINPYGFFLYLPGLLCIPQYQWIDPYRGLVSLLISGFIWDHFFTHTFGFHAFLLSFLFLLIRQLLHLGKQTKQQILYFHLVINIVLASAWFLTSNLFYIGLGDWNVGRFFSDLLLSSIILIPISFWHSQFSSKLVDLFAGYKILNQGLSK
jgi:hypothetical protein